MRSWTAVTVITSRESPPTIPFAPGALDIIEETSEAEEEDHSPRETSPMAGERTSARTGKRTMTWKDMKHSSSKTGAEISKLITPKIERRDATRSRWTTESIMQSIERPRE